MKSQTTVANPGLEALMQELMQALKEEKWQEVQMKASALLEQDPKNHRAIKLKEKAEKILQIDQKEEHYKDLEKKMHGFKKEKQEVYTIEQSIFWIRTFIKEKNFDLAIRACKEVQEVESDNKTVAHLLEYATKQKEAVEMKISAQMEKMKQKAEKEKTLSESKKNTEIERLQFNLKNLLQIGKIDRAEETAQRILELDMHDEEAKKAMDHIVSIKRHSENVTEGMIHVRSSIFSKLRHLYHIYKARGEKQSSQLKNSFFSYFQSSATERLKKKALELVKEKKENNVLAKKLQKNIIPKIDKYTLPGFDVWGDTLQSDTIGGDCFNFIQRDPDNIMFYIGDASGHGIKASLFASQINLILRECIKDHLDLIEMAKKINQRIFEFEKEGKDFMTMVLCNWNVRKKELSFVGCGHEYIIHYKNEEREISMIPSKGIAIGMIEDITPLIFEQRIKIHDHDTLIFFSDGVIEGALKSDEKKLFGSDRLNKLVIDAAGKNSKEMYLQIMQALGEEIVQKDDITLLILKRQEGNDLVFEEDVRGIESVDMKTLQNMSKAEIQQSIHEISLEEKVRTMLHEMKNLMRRGEYQLLIHKCTEAITKDKIYNKAINNFLEKARKAKIKAQQKQDKEILQLGYKQAVSYMKEGDFLRAKTELVKILKLDEKNKKVQHLLQKIEKNLLDTGDNKKKLHKKGFLEDFNIQINKLLDPVRKKDSLDFIVKMSNLINSGIKVKDALTILLKQSKKESVKFMYQTMINNLEKGILLSISMASFQKIFTNIQVNLVKAGEESGNLGNILDDLSKQMLAERDIQKKIKGALIYPAFIISFSILLVAGMMIGVVPKLAEAYEDAGLTLPLPTRIIIGMSNFTQHYWYIVLIALIVGGFLLTAFRKTLLGTEIFDKLQLKMPVLKNLAMKQNIFLFANSLSMLVDSGILLLEAMSTTADVTNNIYYKREVTRMRTEIINGWSLSKALGIDALNEKTKKENEYFPLEVAQMAHVGETTGNITKMLRQVGENYRDDLQQFAKNFSTIIEPFLIVFIGVIVGILLVSIMLPFFEFGKVIKNM